MRRGLDLSYPLNSTVAYTASALAIDYWVIAIHRAPVKPPALVWAGNGFFLSVSLEPAGLLLSAGLGLLFGLMVAVVAKILIARSRARWLASLRNGRRDAEGLLLLGWLMAAAAAFYAGNALLWDGISGYVAAMNVFLGRVLIYPELRDGYRRSVAARGEGIKVPPARAAADSGGES